MYKRQLHDVRPTYRTNERLRNYGGRACVYNHAVQQLLSRPIVVTTEILTPSVIQMKHFIYF